MGKTLTVDQAAELLHMTPEEITWLVQRGDLVGSQKHGEWLVDQASCEVYEAKRRAEQTARQGIADEQESAEEKISDEPDEM